MRMTVLGQYAKGLAHYNPLEVAALQDRLERIQWRLWHGDADEALTAPVNWPRMSLPWPAAIPAWRGWSRRQLGATYIGNNAAAIADYAERWDHGEIISTAFAESTVDLVVSRRFAKKQQMQWSKKGAHRLLQPEPAPSTARCTTCSPAGIRPCPPTMSSPPHSLPQPELPHGFWCSRCSWLPKIGSARAARDCISRSSHSTQVVKPPSSPRWRDHGIG